MYISLPYILFNSSSSSETSHMVCHMRRFSSVRPNLIRPSEHKQPGLGDDIPNNYLLRMINMDPTPVGSLVYVDDTD